MTMTEQDIKQYPSNYEIQRGIWSEIGTTGEHGFSWCFTGTLADYRAEGICRSCGSKKKNLKP